MYEEFADIMQDLPNESGACDRLDRAEINTISWISEFTLTERNKSVFSLVNSAVNTTLPGACLHWLLNAVCSAVVAVCQHLPWSICMSYPHGAQQQTRH